MMPRKLLLCLIGVSLFMLGLIHMTWEGRVVRIGPVLKPMDADGLLSDSEHELLVKFLNISLQSNQDGLCNVSQQINQTIANAVQESHPLIQLYPEVHKSIPKKFNSVYTNPCWFQFGKLKCLPYFYLIGMPKCGTTDLWDKLVQHPQVQNVPKEPHWWSKRRNGWTKTPIHSVQVHRIRHKTKGKDDSSMNWYLNWFEVFAVPTIQKNPKTVIGDGSVSTAFTPLGHWQTDFPGFEDPPYNLPDLMHSVQPSAKIIVIVRDPVSRFYSAHLYTGGSSNKSFKRAVVQSVECMETCLSRHTDRYCAYQQVCDQIFRGMYVIYVADWIRAFGYEQVHVVRLDNWINKPVEAYKDLINFLELDALTDSAIKSIFNKSVKNSQKKKKKKAGDMFLSSKKLLQAFYKPYNHKLAALLNNSKYLWDYG